MCKKCVLEIQMPKHLRPLNFPFPNRSLGTINFGNWSKHMCKSVPVLRPWKKWNCLEAANESCPKFELSCGNAAMHNNFGKLIDFFAKTSSLRILSHVVQAMLWKYFDVYAWSNGDKTETIWCAEMDFGVTGLKVFRSVHLMLPAAATTWVKFDGRQRKQTK